MKPYTRCQIRCLDNGTIYNNLTEAAAAVGCGKSAMCNHLAGRFPHIRGMKFERVWINHVQTQKTR